MRGKGRGAREPSRRHLGYLLFADKRQAPRLLCPWSGANTVMSGSLCLFLQLPDGGQGDTGRESRMEAHGRPHTGGPCWIHRLHWKWLEMRVFLLYLQLVNLSTASPVPSTPFLYAACVRKCVFTLGKTLAMGGRPAYSSCHNYKGESW